jgi:hypothetical protein
LFRKPKIAKIIVKNSAIASLMQMADSSGDPLEIFRRTGWANAKAHWNFGFVWEAKQNSFGRLLAARRKRTAMGEMVL